MTGWARNQLDPGLLGVTCALGGAAANQRTVTSSRIGCAARVTRRSTVRLGPKHQILGYITHVHLVIRHETLAHLRSWLVVRLHSELVEGEIPT